MRVDVFVVGDNEGYVVAPAGRPLPLDEMLALGALRYGWALDSERAAMRLDWRAIATDIDARGYGVVSREDVTGLLAQPQRWLPALYPEHHRRAA
ncbi:hypothetical protein [Lysobacter silvisoli]|uniref:Uncharacterized protein n=1 Tax=Lysobacter silvisoli TaxID=2293254 RepID=A0A371K4R7_9GAMM|nr:hypothetical protein [Lysobacter silvisoli]RDZ28919.1 hypothetical protein DX914_07395 [Lysobacter silvisoli]